MTFHQRQWLLDRPGLPAERELPVLVDVDLTLLGSCETTLRAQIASMRSTQRLLGKVCLSQSIDDAHEKLVELLDQIEDEVLGRMDVERERERAKESWHA